MQISKYFWFMLASSAIYLPMVSCFNMPFVSLGNELTPDYHERTSVFRSRTRCRRSRRSVCSCSAGFFHRRLDRADTTNVFQRVKLMFTSAKAWKTAPDDLMPQVNMLLGARPTS